MLEWISLLHDCCVSCSDLICFVAYTELAMLLFIANGQPGLQHGLPAPPVALTPQQTIARLRFITLGSSFPYGNEEPVCNIPARLFLNSSHCSASHREDDKGSLWTEVVAGLGQIHPLGAALEKWPSITPEEMTHGWCWLLWVAPGSKTKAGEDPRQLSQGIAGGDRLL